MRSTQPAKGRGRAFRAAMRAAHEIRTQRYQETAREIVTEADGADELLAAAMLPFADCERCGDDRTSRMRLGDGLEIISLVGVSAHGVGKRRVDRRGAEIGADDRRLRVAAEGPYIFQCHDTRIHVRPRHHRAERIENAVLAFDHHLRRQFLIACGNHVARKPLRDAGTRCPGSAGSQRQRSDRTCRFQDMPA